MSDEAFDLACANHYCSNTFSGGRFELVGLKSPDPIHQRVIGLALCQPCAVIALSALRVRRDRHEPQAREGTVVLRCCNEPWLVASHPSGDIWGFLLTVSCCRCKTVHAEFKATAP